MVQNSGFNSFTSNPSAYSLGGAPASPFEGFGRGNATKTSFGNYGATYPSPTFLPLEPLGRDESPYGTDQFQRRAIQPTPDFSNVMGSNISPFTLAVSREAVTGPNVTNAKFEVMEAEIQELRAALEKARGQAVPESSVVDSDAKYSLGQRIKAGVRGAIENVKNGMARNLIFSGAFLAGSYGLQFLTAGAIGFGNPLMLVASFAAIYLLFDAGYGAYIGAKHPQYFI